MTAISTRYTYDFIRANLPRGTKGVLEVGCGRGELAAELIGDGLDVTAIDNDVESVASAQSLGVDARLAAWPTELHQKVDAVLFTRSLHHIHELEDAIRSAVQVLQPGGRIIVEDFCAEGGTSRSTMWFGGLVRLLEASGAFRSGFDLQSTLAKPEPDDDGHELHASTTIGDALAHFGRVEHEDSAYYFRYLELEFRSVAASEMLLSHELLLIDAGAIDALGKRYVLEPTS